MMLSGQFFVGLSKDALFVKYLHGTTQNANEVLNKFDWTKCPKNVLNSSITYINKNLIVTKNKVVLLGINQQNNCLSVN